MTIWGRSAAGGVARVGIERMIAEVCLGKVSVVAAREVSRFGSQQPRLRLRALRTSWHATTAKSVRNAPTSGFARSLAWRTKRSWTECRRGAQRPSVLNRRREAVEHPFGSIKPPRTIQAGGGTPNNRASHSSISGGPTLIRLASGWAGLTK